MKKSVRKIVFHNTGYTVLTNGRQWAVIRIQKSKNLGRYMFKRIERIEIVSLPEDTGFVKDPAVNVNNPSLMARIAEKEGKETVVVNGKFEHISFISNEKPMPLVVSEFVPPNPPKLLELVERALDAGRIQKPIKMIANILDLNRLAKASDKSFVMFPCLTDDLNCGKNVIFLAGNPNISSIGIDNTALIGCDYSLRIFKSVYGKKPAFIDTCPAHREGIIKKKGVRCITRCCKIGEGHLRIGNTAYVAYDPTLSDVEEAILDLFELERVKTAKSYKTLPAIKFLFNLYMRRKLSQ